LLEIHGGASDLSGSHSAASKRQINRICDAAITGVEDAPKAMAAIRRQLPNAK
jgi:hypothetical protein